jgi:HK97 family phage prohead protease
MPALATPARPHLGHLPTVRARPSTAARQRHQGALAQWQQEHGATADGLPHSVDAATSALVDTLRAANTDVYLAQMNRIARTVGLAARGSIRTVAPGRAAQIAHQAQQSAQSIVSTQTGRAQSARDANPDDPEAAQQAFDSWNAGQQQLISRYESGRASTAAMMDMLSANPSLQGEEWIEPGTSSGDADCEDAIALGHQPLGTFSADPPPYHPNCVHYVCQSYGQPDDPAALWIPGDVESGDAPALQAAPAGQGDDAMSKGAAMDLEYTGLALEIKTVDVSHRVISGYAAAHNNVDRVHDIIDPGASVKAVARLGQPSDVAVFVGHNSSMLPVGIPQRIEATPQGLYTETYILKGPEGDNLLAVAKDLAAHGQSLGMSIGYRTQDAKPERYGTKTVRRILDYELKEYSFASAQAIANPLALVSAVKARQDALRGARSAVDSAQRGARTAPGHKVLQYRVQQEGDQWLVVCDVDADGDEGPAGPGDDRVVGSYESAETANAVSFALRREQGAAQEEEDDQGEQEQTDPDAKTVSGVDDLKAEWSTAAVNTLPNSAFLYVEDGDDDEEGKRVPRSKRHFPYKDAEGKVDLPHLRNAVARIPQSSLSADLKDRLQARARRLLEQAQDGKTVSEGAEWTDGAPLQIRALGYHLIDLSEQLASELKAMELLGEETKSFMRIRPEMRSELSALLQRGQQLLQWAETIDRGEDGKARVAWLQKQLALTEV